MSGTILQETPVLRDISPRDASACHALTQAVGWPHRVEDCEMVIRLGRGVVAARGGEIVAMALWWPYGERHARLGMIIVSPQHQGGGLGKQLMQALLEQTQGRSLMLNATAAGEPLYARLGFAPCGGVRQHQGEVSAAVAGPTVPAGDTLRAGSGADLPLLQQLDAQASGLPRRPALDVLLASGECVVLERAGRPVGFSVLRRFGRGLVVGPVIAGAVVDAKCLIAHWLQQNHGAFIRVDVPAGSGLGAWLAENGLKQAGAVTAMVRGELPAAPGAAKLYGLISQALG